MSGVDWRTLREGQRVEVTVQGVVKGEGDDRLVMLDGGAVSTLFTTAEADAATWRLLSDPLPTAPGAYVEATVTRSGVAVPNVRLMRVTPESWTSASVIEGYGFHGDDHLSDVRVIDDPGATS